MSTVIPRALPQQDTPPTVSSSAVRSVSQECPPLLVASGDARRLPSRLPVVFNLMNAVIGVGVLAMPYCFRRAGLVLGLCLLAGIGVVTERSLSLLVLAGDACGTVSIGYAATVQKCFGAGAGLLVDIAIVVMNFGAAVAYLDIIADVLCAWVGQDLKVAVLAAVVAVVIWPLSSIKAVTQLRFSSFLGVAVYCTFGVIVFVLYFIVSLEREPLVPSSSSSPPSSSSSSSTAPLQAPKAKAGNTTVAHPENNSTEAAFPELVLASDEFLVAVPIVSLAYACHTVVFPVYKEYCAAGAMPAELPPPGGDELAYVSVEAGTVRSQKSRRNSLLQQHSHRLSKSFRRAMQWTLLCCFAMCVVALRWWGRTGQNRAERDRKG